MNASVVEEIKGKVDIVDLVGSYVSLKHAGKYFKANCPFHQEKTPSFVVSPDIQRWHCFGACHEGGDIFTFVMKWENVSFGEALRILAERAGVVLSSQSGASGFQDHDEEKRAIIFKINELAARYYHYLLENSQTAILAKEYLKERGTSDQIAQTFQIGYAPEGWTNIRDYLIKKGFQEADLMMTGLFVQGERGIYDRFRGRLMFPIKNTRGLVVGFSGRLIKKEPTEKDGGKYVNTPETLVYHKRESLYGFFHTKDEIKKSNTAVVVEGEFDMITPFSKGIGNIVAIKGSAFTEEQLRTLRRYCGRLVLALDNDPAGFDALRKSVADAQQFGFELYVCPVPSGKDPDDAARTHLSELKNAIQHPIPVYDHIIDVLFKKVDAENPFSKKTFAENIVPYIEMIDNPIVKTHYIQKLAGLIQSTEDNIKSLLQDYRRKAKAPAPRKTVELAPEVLHDGLLIKQKHILSVLFTSCQKDEELQIVREILKPEDFTISPFRKLYESFLANVGNNPRFSNESFVNTLPAELKPVFEEIFLYASIAEQNTISEIRSLILRYKKEYIQSRLKSELEVGDEEFQSLTNELIAVDKMLKIG